MKKEDLLLVFDFLATALKQDSQEETKVEKQRESLSYDELGDKVSEPKAKEEDKTGYHVNFITGVTETIVEEHKPSEVIIETNPITPTEKVVQGYINDINAIRGIKPDDNTFIKKITTESARVKELIDIVENGKTYPYIIKKKTTPAEDAVNKALKEHQQSIAVQLNLLETKLRDSLATPEQRQMFKEFVKMETFKTKKELDRIEYFLNNPKLDNPYQVKDEESEPKKEVKTEIKPSFDLSNLSKELKDKEFGKPISVLSDEVKSNIEKILDEKPKIRRRFYDGKNGNMLYE